MNEHQINNPEQEARREDELSVNKEPDGLYLGDSKLETGPEFQQNKKSDHAKEDNQATASDAYDLQSNGEVAAGTDRAGTAERKPYGDVELNKGLEAQAMDEES